MNINNHPHIPHEEQIALPYFLVDHGYFLPIVKENNSNEQRALPYHLVDHGYFQPVLNENNPDEQSDLPDHLVDHDYFQPVVYEDHLNEELVDVEVLEDIDVTEVEVVARIPEEISIDQVPETYITIPGVHHGSRVFVDNLGFKYYKREERANCIYLICERQKSRHYNFCPCTAIVSREFTDNSITIRAQHNHPSPNINLHVPFLREEIGARSIDLTNMCESVRTVYNNAIIEFSEAAENYTFTQGRRRWKRMRRYRKPNGRQVSEDYNKLADEALNYPEKNT